MIRFKYMFNFSETSKMTKNILKPLEWLKHLQNLRNDQNNFKTSKMTKIILKQL